RAGRGEGRSLKISQRIDDLRGMLNRSGISLKASKSAVLSEATNYIAQLQQRHVFLEAERIQLLQMVQTYHQAAGGAGGASVAPATAAAATAAATGLRVFPPALSLLPGQLQPPPTRVGGAGGGVG
ncbi:unnamed protein product, partial [Discosporangium mesarthrocarpum]